MRLFLTVAILLVQSQIQAQGDFISYRFQVDPKQYMDYNINFTVIDRLDKLLVAYSAGYMLLFINFSSKINYSEIKTTTLEEMLNYDSLVVENLPLYQNQALKQGFYTSYQDLLLQKNEIIFDSLSSCKPKNKKIKVIKNGLEQCYFKDSFYALVIDNQVYVNLESKWYKVNFKQKNVVFNGLMNPFFIDYSNALIQGLLFGAYASSMAISNSANTKTWHKIKISKKTGKPKVIAISERPKDDELDLDLSRFYIK